MGWSWLDFSPGVAADQPREDSRRVGWYPRSGTGRTPNSNTIAPNEVRVLHTMYSLLRWRHLTLHAKGLYWDLGAALYNGRNAGRSGNVRFVGSRGAGRRLLLSLCSTADGRNRSCGHSSIWQVSLFVLSGGGRSHTGDRGASSPVVAQGAPRIDTQRAESRQGGGGETGEHESGGGAS